MKINEAIKQLRETYGLTVAELARKLNVAPLTIRRWESGIHRPSPMALKLLEELFPGFEKGRRA